MKLNKGSKYHLDLGQGSLTTGASGQRSGAIRLSDADLHALIEGIVGEDADRAFVKSIEVEVDMYHMGPAVVQFAAALALVQSAGSMSYGPFATVNIIDDLVDDMSDDSIGFRLFQLPHMSRFVLGWYTTADVYLTKWTCKIQIPKDIINLLNKEVETERLQPVYLVVLLPEVNGDSKAVYATWSIKVEYVEQSKGITIR
jgi:hypothetical protein